MGAFPSLAQSDMVCICSLIHHSSISSAQGSTPTTPAHVFVNRAISCS